jgi:hypothetical protein
MFCFINLLEFLHALFWCKLFLSAILSNNCQQSKLIKFVDFVAWTM